MMKKYIILFLLVMLSRVGFSQVLTVVDQTTLQPVADVQITSQKPEASTATDALGQADISKFIGSDGISILGVGYKEENLTYTELQEKKFRIALIQKSYTTEEIVISANKFSEKQQYVPQQVEVIREDELSFWSQQNTADVLTRTGNVLVQKSQLGGGSPILRGFEASRVLIVIDGVRLNNAIFRTGHLQNLLRIDNNVLKQAEVMFGPGSVLYGSDALGGVMAFYTKDPILSLTKKPVYKVNAFGRYSYADNEKTGHLDFNLGFKNVGFLGSFTFSDFGDLRQGKSDVKDTLWLRKYYVERINGVDTMIANDDDAVQKQSGYQQYDILGKVFIKQSNTIWHTLNFQFSNTNDVPRYDRLNTYGSNGKLSSAEWYYGPEKRLFGMYKLNITPQKSFFNDGKLILSFQDIEESRNNRSFGKSTFTSRKENIKIYSANLDFFTKITSHEFSYGAEVNYNDLKSTAYKKNIKTGEESPADTRYPDGGSKMTNFGLYLTHLFKMDSYTTLTSGLRFSSVNLKATINDTTFFKFPFKEIEQNNLAMNGSIGLIVSPKNDWRISLIGSTGFRAPNVDDLAKIFESVPGNVIVPNPDLKPEYSYNIELGVSKVFNKMVKVSATGYYTMLRDAIVTDKFLFNGQDSIIYDGQLSAVTANQNKLKAYVYGINFELDADITNNFSFAGTVNYTYGRIKTDSTDYPLDHIPPLYGKGSLIYKRDKFKTEFYVLFNGKKNKDDYNMFGEDNFASATPDGMPAWYTLNLSAAYTLNRYLQIEAGVENILDKNYRVFASGISAPGRNYFVTLKAGY